jgi:5-methyltetrahydropteroyltriglutamate--homocysteine methyltransferase
MFTPTLNGSFPRFPEPARSKLLSEALEKHRDGIIIDTTLHRAFDRASVEAVVEMIAAGIEIPSDGQIRWQDEIAYMCAGLDGFRGGFEGDPDAEYDDYWRLYNPRRRSSTPDSELQVAYPEAVKKITWHKSVVVDDFCFMAVRSPVEVRAVITGPFSLARSVKPGIYGEDIRQLTLDIASALNEELKILCKAGAKYVLVEEPLLLYNKDQAGIFAEASKVLCADVEASVMVGTHGSDVLGIEDVLLESPFDGISFDMINGADNISVLEKKGFWGDKIIQIGLIDSESEVIETPMAIALYLIDLSNYHNAGNIWVAPSGGMRNLSRTTAFNKLKAMSEGADWARRELARREVPGGKIRSEE